MYNKMKCGEVGESILHVFTATNNLGKNTCLFTNIIMLLYNNGTLDKTDVHKWSTRDSRTIFSPFIIPHYRENDTLSINVERMDNSIDGLLIFRIF